ncbi:oxidoreductase [Bifidobacterium psychraerophilum]|uniref:oxidoreductase n=1 Tax=Bifidobacterium psychraerophilum TaxID=218140 RepID=UPI0039E9ECE5
MNSSRWLITGASSGLGRALAEQALSVGHRVAATARDPKKVADLQRQYPDRVAVIRLDVTEKSSIAMAVQEAEERFGGIDVLVNNAGYGYTAAVEEGEDAEVERMFLTNFTGPLEIIKAVLPAMRNRRSGLIVNISSIGAKLTIPGGGYYSAAKAALEAISGSLRRETVDMGIHVITVEPGSLRTDFRGRSARQSSIRIGDYDRVLGRVGEKRLGPQRGDPAKAAKAIVDTVDEGNPPKLLILGSDALAGYEAFVKEEGDAVNRYRSVTLSSDA